MENPHDTEAETPRFAPVRVLGTAGQVGVAQVLKKPVSGQPAAGLLEQSPITETRNGHKFDRAVRAT